MEVSEGGTCVSGLEIRLSIKVLCLDKRHVFVLGGGAYEEISRNRLIVHDFDKVANSDILPHGFVPMGPNIFAGISKHMMFNLLHGIRAVVLDIGILLGCTTSLNVLPLWTASWDDTPDEGPTFSTIQIRVNPIATGKDANLRMVDVTV